jgi:hypothetical protein
MCQPFSNSVGMILTQAFDVSPFTRLKTSLGAMYAKFGCAVLFFEVGRLSMKGGHAHVQAVPIPLRLKDKIEETFLREGRTQGIDFEEDPDAAMASCANGRGSYFKVDLPDGRKMVHLLKDHIPFSIQFGRYGNSLL